VVPQKNSPKVLILGSAPNVVAVKDIDVSSYDEIIVINNAWQVLGSWTEHIFPYDFPQENKPLRYAKGQRPIDEKLFVRRQNEFGGFIYGGGTMAFTALYWALGEHMPSEIHILGCDMVYPDAGKTHFYGAGTPDPLREDFTLRDLYAKSARFMCLAAINGCSTYNLSDQNSKLCFPRRSRNIDDNPCHLLINNASVQSILDQEKSLGYFISSGRYWEADLKVDLQALDIVDQQWKTLSAKIMRLDCYT
jgi:hypothetical protein